jgi:hypothetical protein
MAKIGIVLVRAFALMVVIAASLPPAAGQVRDASAPGRSSSADGAVEGRVELIDGGLATPLRRARIVLTHPSAEPITTETNVDGDFRVEGVPAGQYRIAVERAGVVPAAAATTAGVSAFSTIEVAARETTTVVLRMIRAAAFEGRVVDATGTPAANLMVTADLLRRSGDGYATVETRWERTDDLGRFRVHTLIPGAYRLRVSASSRTSGEPRFYPGTPTQEQAAIITATAGETTAPLDFVVDAPPPAPGGAGPRQAIEGRVVDEFGDAVPGVSMQALVRRVIGGQSFLRPAGASEGIFGGWTDDRGVFRFFDLPPDEYFLFAKTGIFGESKTWASSLKFEAPIGFAPTFYPGTADPTAAAPISLAAGSDQTGLDFRLLPTAVTTVIGTILDPDGQPLPTAAVVIGSTSNLLTTRLQADAAGVYRVKGLPDGAHLLQAQHRELMGATTLEVPAADRPQIVDGTIRLRPLSRAEGHVRFDGEGTKPATVAVFVRPVGLDPTSPISLSALAETDANGRFEIRQFLKAGVVRVTAPGWVLKSVVHNGQDITDTPYAFFSEDVTGLEVTLTNRLGWIQGVIEGEARPEQATVVLFPPDSSQWGMASRLVAVARSVQPGGFTVRDLLPGPYLAVAATGIGTTATDISAEWLERVRPFAVPISIGEGANAILSLRVVKPTQ